MLRRDACDLNPTFGATRPFPWVCLLASHLEQKTCSTTGLLQIDAWHPRDRKRALKLLPLQSRRIRNSEGPEFFILDKNAAYEIIYRTSRCTTKYSAEWSLFRFSDQSADRTTLCVLSIILAVADHEAPKKYPVAATAYRA
jgi:hypothetical protein